MREGGFQFAAWDPACLSISSFKLKLSTTLQFVISDKYVKGFTADTSTGKFRGRMRSIC